MVRVLKEVGCLTTRAQRWSLNSDHVTESSSSLLGADIVTHFLKMRELSLRLV